MGSHYFDEKLSVDTLVPNEDVSHQNKLYSHGKLKFSKYYDSIVTERITSNQYINQYL